MNIICAFTSQGAPATGLDPVLSGWTTDGSLVVSGETMSEIGSTGWYSYSFTGYDYLEQYVFTAYESSLSAGEQYVFLSNDKDSQNNQGIIKQILGLVQGNSRISNQTYDSNGNLIAANIYTYPTSADCVADTNVLHSYEIQASYTDGKLTGYRSREI